VLDAKVELCTSSGSESRKLCKSGWRSALLKCGSVVVAFAHGLSASALKCIDIPKFAC